VSALARSLAGVQGATHPELLPHESEDLHITGASPAEMEKQQTPIRSARLAGGAPANATLRSWDVGQQTGRLKRFPAVEDKRSGVVRPTSTVRAFPAASLLFAPGDRPGADQVRALAAADPSFLVSFDPEEQATASATCPQERWLEVLANGLTFDVQGLAPGTSQPVPRSTHCYGLPADFDGVALEAISLRPGRQFASAGPVLSVARGLAWLAAVLAGLPGVVAVGWHSARTISAAHHFRGSVLRWVNGGAFPGLGLTALGPTPDGGMQSDGLALFNGQELRLAPELARDRAAGARLAVRLLHWLVERGRLDAPTGLVGPSGEALVLAPSENKRFVEVSLG